MTGDDRYEISMNTDESDTEFNYVYDDRKDENVALPVGKS